MNNLKKVISSVAAFAIVASSASAFAITFPDVDASASYASAVNDLTALGIVNGDDNGLFNPDNSVTRAEFTKMAVEALGEGDAATSQTTSQFVDAATTSQHWAAGYVAQGVADGFINGYDETRFGPDDQVTYAQACKMLVAAIGYTVYAENQGGYPSGYVAQASTLGISKGVSATNDTNLTRAQVAVLIDNAIKVPLCEITEWETQQTINGSIQVPKYEKRDDWNDGNEYKTLLTDRHDAYVVKGRVQETHQSAGLDNGKVRYRVEVSDNFDGEEYKARDSRATDANYTGYEMYVGDTNASDLLFAYTEAIVQKDEDTDEYTILTITSYGATNTVSFKTEDVADDDSTIGTNYITKTDSNGKTTDVYKIPVYKTSTSSTTTKYDLNTDVVLYVNGKSAGAPDNAAIKTYILDNKTGTVTLVSSTAYGSTSANNKYNYIMVDYYKDRVVDYVQESSSYIRVAFKDGGRIQWDPDNEDQEVTFTLDGKDVAYTDLEEYDVLSLKYDLLKYTGTTSLIDPDYCTALVSRNKAEGTVTSINEDDAVITLDGTDYDLGAWATSNFEISSNYALYIDAFGYVAYSDEGTTDKNYGVIVAMYKSAGNDYPTVRLITSDAQVVAYETKSQAEANNFYTYATTGKTDGSVKCPSNVSLTKSDLSTRINAGQTVCGYKLSGGKIRFDKEYQNTVGGTGLEFKASNSKLGSYTISDSTTKLIDMDSYMNGSDSSVATLSVSDLEDEATYTAYLYDKNSNGDYRFGIVLDGVSSIRPKTTIAVVKEVKGTTDVDSTSCDTYIVGRGGKEDVEVLMEVGAFKDSDGNNKKLTEGSIVAYTVSSDGYVEAGDLYVIYQPASSYESLLTAVTKNTDFTTGLSYVNSNLIEYKTGDTDSKVKAYLGVTYRKQNANLELFVKQTNDISAVADVKTFTIDSNTNVYTFDYNQRDKQGLRLSVSSAPSQNNSIFNGDYVTSTGADDTGNDKNYVSWTKVIGDEITPQIVFVKEVDGDVTDAVFFIK